MEYVKKITDLQLFGNQKLGIGGAVATGFLGLIYLRRYLQNNMYTNTNRIDGKVAIVTGSNTGLGKETALEFAKRGAKVYLACRDMTRCEVTRKEIIDLTNNPNVFARKLDLGSLVSVREFVKNFHEEEHQLDILVNNAGVAGIEKTITSEGFETVFVTNHLGHFLLTNLLLDTLKKSAPSRIVVVSAMGHRWGTINKNDVMGLENYDKKRAYCITKLANVMFTRNLAKKLDGTGVTVNTLHPGVVQTEIFRNFGPISSMLLKPVLFLFSKSAEKGAQTQIKLALDPELEKVSGKYFVNCKETEPAQNAKDDELAEWLWNKSAEMAGIDGKINSL